MTTRMCIARTPSLWRMRRTLMGQAGVIAMVSAVACTPLPIKEVAGPTQSSPMASPGPYRAEYVTTMRREGAREPFEFLRLDHPFASVILLTGGDGVIQLSPNGIRRSGNFLVRSRTLFAEQGLAVAVVDAPSDHATLNGFRTSEGHALDLKGVIAFLREQAPVPVWLVGTSYGTVSAAKAADWLADGGGPDGIVLTSSLFIPGRYGDSVYNADPARIRIPLLLVHNRSDRCPSTPFSQAATYVKRMTQANPAELTAVAGGGPVHGDPCEPFDYHGFPGLESQVVTLIAQWIRTHPPQAGARGDTH